MRGFVVVLVAFVSLAGCGSDSPTGPRSKSSAETRTASADLKDRFLLDHNAAFNDGFTFRWVPPIPIFVITGDDFADGAIMEQFLAWERALAGAGGTPFYEPRPVTNFLPSRGIVLAIADLPGNVVGFGDPFSPLAQLPKGQNPVGARLRQLKVSAAVRKLEIPELTAARSSAAASSWIPFSWMRRWPPSTPCCATRWATAWGSSATCRTATASCIPRRAARSPSPPTSRG